MLSQAVAGGRSEICIGGGGIEQDGGCQVRRKSGERFAPPLPCMYTEDGEETCSSRR